MLTEAGGALRVERAGLSGLSGATSSIGKKPRAWVPEGWRADGSGSSTAARRAATEHAVANDQMKLTTQIEGGTINRTACRRCNVLEPALTLMSYRVTVRHKPWDRLSSSM